MRDPNADLRTRLSLGSSEKGTSRLQRGAVGPAPRTPQHSGTGFGAPSPCVPIHIMTPTMWTHAGIFLPEHQALGFSYHSCLQPRPLLWAPDLLIWLPGCVTSSTHCKRLNIHTLLQRPLLFLLNE
ncbi:uncharacterized protein [Gorilla gorilla gorilla]|uniref:uncharacterized protein n=1 Tax=Gorilla gorilla gorilla TaxID=9595 RepID=UPI0030092DA1